MNKSYLFLANGFEEIEALATVDILRRAGIPVETVSINDTLVATGAHGVAVEADTLIADIDIDYALWLILPGGLPGATNLADCQLLDGMLRTHHANGGKIAAICASPAYVLGTKGILDGVDATCYPGCESVAPDVHFTGNDVEVTPSIITGRGPGLTFKYALAIVEATLGADAARKVADGMLL